MKNLKKLSIDSMMAVMPVLSNELQRSVVGGYQYDCFWRCLAYLDTSGKHYTEQDAEYYAEDYFGGSGSMHSNGAGVTDSQILEYQRDNFDRFSGLILQFNPEGVIGLNGEDLHMVIPLVKHADGSYSIYDPQQELYYVVPASAVTGLIGFAGPEGNYGGSNYAGSDYYASSDYGGSDYGGSGYN